MVAALLILALTIVLAGIFGAFAMGLINPAALTGKIVGVTAESYGTDTDHGVRMTYWGGKDADQLVSIRAQVGGYGLFTADGQPELTNVVVGGKYDFSLKIENETYDEHGTKITTTKITNAGELVGQQVTFVGAFRDGTEQVIYLWKISVPGVDVDPGEYAGNDANISIRGFSNSTEYDGDAVPGHGLLIERLDEHVVSVQIIEADLKLVADNTQTYKLENLFAKTTLAYNEIGTDTIYSAVYPADKLEELQPTTSRDGALTGSVKLKVNFDKYAPSYCITCNVYIPPRVCVMEDGRHKATEIKSYNTTCNRLNLTLNELTTSSFATGKTNYIVYVNDAKIKTGQVKDPDANRLIS
ncbi:MAG: hypothetical protein Q4Q04_04895, partial [Methanocorpusculum sp.]|nr:hypothetical protein [Methanocorpusculum sp.]